MIYTQRSSTGLCTTSQRSEDEEGLTIPEVMKCFNKQGELPRVFLQTEVYNDVENDYAAIIPCYLHSAVYIGVTDHFYATKGLIFLKLL